jgi:hypothetical protein
VPEEAERDRGDPEAEDQSVQAEAFRKEAEEHLSDLFKHLSGELFYPPCIIAFSKLANSVTVLGME